MATSAFLLGAILVLAQATGTVSGRITNIEGRPVANIRVMAVAADDPQGQPANTILSSAQTDRSGNYRIENVPVGRYYITAGLVDLPSYYPGVTQPSAATVVDVTARVSLRGMDFAQVRPTSLKLSGRVVRANTNPVQAIPKARVWLRVAAGPPIDEVADAAGNFEFANIRPGSYSVNVGGAVTMTPVPIVVEDKDVVGIEVPVQSLNHVAGRVVVENGGPIPRLTLSANGTAGPILMPIADRSFSLTLPEGEPRLSIVPGSLTAGYSVRSFTYGRSDLLREPLRNTFSSDDELVLTVRSPNVSRVTVRGRVLATDLKLAGGRVTLSSPNLGETRSAEVRNDGTFAIPGVLPGTYTAKSTFDGASAPTIEVGTSDLRNVEIVVPTFSAASMDPEKLAGSLSWVILDANGAAVDRGSRSIRLKDVALWAAGSKHIALNGQFSLGLMDTPREYRGEQTFFSLAARTTKGDHMSMESFTMDSPGHAAKRRGPDELGIEVSEVAGRWDITRTEFLSDVTIAVRRPVTTFGQPLPPTEYTVVIQKGSVISWPSLINGKTVGN